ncbi:OTU domain-containing protein 6B-like protein [Leptotrombidium deliense]|uniref:OTU domain-containing protein 6B-like protein n=1 Tax=Leptotrombidium deliense TaxID=299467 RepID=A0A443SFD6_9ACAR|nr:OTU domain-containing protein 6B-like protein [Leptotrombidium deliense]
MDAKEILDAKHREENKKLQVQIQVLKRSVTKGDKRRQKEVQQEIQRLQCELKAKHDKEKSDAEANENNSEIYLRDLTISDMGAASDLLEQNEPDVQMRKASKAQRKREKKHLKEKERELRVAAEEAENVYSARNLEAEKLNKILQQKGYTVHEIPSDGDCMYKAIEHQLGILNITICVRELRENCANVLRQRKPDFLPYLTSRETDNLMTDDEYEKYCEEVANTKMWGGHVELKALSSYLKRPIQVYQANGPVVITGDEYQEQPLIISYHRYAYHLGEHYNSVVENVKS